MLGSSCAGPYLEGFSAVGGAGPSTPRRDVINKGSELVIGADVGVSKEDEYWVVTSGVKPGVYQGMYVGVLTLYDFLTLLTLICRTLASAAMGDRSPRRAFKIGSRAEAEHEFSKRYMEGEVVKVDSIE